MSSAIDAVTAAHAALETAKAEAKLERVVADRIEREKRAARLAEGTRDYRDSNFSGTVGDDGDYVGITHSYDGGIEISAVEYSSVHGSVTLNAAQALELRDLLNELLG